MRAWIVSAAITFAVPGFVLAQSNKTGQGADTAAGETGTWLDKAANKTGRGLDKAADKTGQGLDKAADKTGQGLDTAADKTEKGLDKASRKAGQGYEKAKEGAAAAREKTGEGVEALGEKTEQAGSAMQKPSAANPLDLNSATEEELKQLPGIGEARAKKIIEARPYDKKDQLVSKKVIDKSTYKKIKNSVVAKQPTP